MEENFNTAEEQKGKNKKDKKTFNKKSILKSVYYIFIVSGLGVSGFLGYRYLQDIKNDLINTDTNVGEIKSKINSIEETVSINNSKVDTFINQGSYYSSPTQVFANITVEKVLEDKNTALEDGFRFIIFDVKLENKTQNDVYFYGQELKLKDSDNYEYSFYDNSPISKEYIKKDSKVLLPDNRIPLSGSNLKPGETVKGSLVFVVNRPGTKFTLIRNGEVLRAVNL
jgi:hypothetical protein